MTMYVSGQSPYDFHKGRKVLGTKEEKILHKSINQYCQKLKSYCNLIHSIMHVVPINNYIVTH